MTPATLVRGRLARHPAWSRALAQQELASRLILPVVVSDEVDDREPVEGMPGLERLSLTELERLARRLSSLGVAGVLILGASDRKDEVALLASEPDHIVPRAIRTVKQAVPDLAVVSDVCVCAYVAHGQCVLFDRGAADVEGTLVRLAEIAVVHADAGADLLVLSGMLDDAVPRVRAGLDRHQGLPLAAMARVESVFDAAERLATRTVAIEERAVPLLVPEEGAVVARMRREAAAGADAIVLAPGAPTTDLVRAAAMELEIPIIAEHTGDEYAALLAAAELLPVGRAERELVAASRRAGAQLIVTHAAVAIAED